MQALKCVVVGDGAVGRLYNEYVLKEGGGWRYVLSQIIFKKQIL